MRNKFRMMLLSMATLGLFSCYCDNLVDEVATQPSQQEEADGYVAFKINTIGSDSRTTRADDDAKFDTGEDQEFAISSERGSSAVFFFKKEGDGVYKYHSKADLQLSLADESPDHNDEYETDAEEKVYKAHISTDLVESGYDAYCVVILNADPSTLRTLHSKLAGKTLTDFMQSDRTLPFTDGGIYTNGGKMYFTMTNTIYIGSKDQIQGPTEVTAEDIKETMEEAAEGEPINVHVERLVAKYELGFEHLTDNVIAQDNTQRLMGPNSIIDVKWAVKILGWDVSGLEKTTYWFKNLYDGTNFTSFSYPEAVMSTKDFGKWAFAAGMKGGWNDVSRVRSYWAVDPHYNAATDFYPTQYRYDGTNKSVLKKEGGKNIPALEYKSYEDLADYTDDEAGLAKYRYSLENTFGNYDWLNTITDNTYEFSGDDYKLADTHILIKAQLLLGTTVGADPSVQTDIYYYDNCYWTDEDQLLDKMIEELIYTYASTGLYYGTEHTPLLTKENAKTAGLFEIVSAKGVEHADGRVMLQLKDEKQLYTKVGENYSKITNEALIADNDRNLVTAKHYNNGYMYYAIPVQHLAGIDNIGDETKYNIGSFGVVRNHWYKATVTNISNPGTPVDDPTQPIIPDNDPDENGYASFQIQIIPWRVVDWNVDL